MPNIDTYLRRIREATYGKNVREAIASGIEECYRQVSGNPEFYNSVASILGTDATATATRGQTIEDIGATVHTEDGHLVFSFVLPKGDKGDTGGVRAITLGETEILDYDQQASVSVDYPSATDPSDHSEPRFTFHLPRGPKGDKGDTGSVSSIQLENPIKLAYNLNPLVSVRYATGADGQPDTSRPIFRFGIPQGEPGSIDNVTARSIFIGPDTETTIADALNDLESRSGFCVRVMLSSAGSDTVEDQRITANHVLTGYRFYNESSVQTDLALADFTWTTADGVLTVDVSKVYETGSMILDFGWRQDITDSE